MARDLLHFHQHIRRTADATTTKLTSAMTPTLSSSISTSSTTTSPEISSIEPYTTALNGVNTKMNIVWQDVVWWSLGIFAMMVLVLRVIEMVRNHIRHMVAMNAGKHNQTFWSRNTTVWWPLVKKQLLYAPLWNKRHNREFRISSAINVGTLPSRFHTLILGAYIFSNITYCALLDYSIGNKYIVLASLRGRSGVLAVVNMIALVLLAGRNNPLITLLKVSFDTYNLLHRWMGRIVVLESCLHVLAWLIVKVAADDWSGTFKALRTDPFSTWGLIGAVAMVCLATFSPGFFRHAFYETFLNFHIIFAMTAIVGIWMHCEIAGLPQLPYVQICVGLWAGDRLLRLYRILSCNYSFSRNSWTRATIEVLPGEACRVKLSLPKYMTIKPGSHAYLRFASVNPLETHPFSIAWVKHESIMSPSLPVYTSRSRSGTDDSLPDSMDDEIEFEKYGTRPGAMKRNNTTCAAVQKKRLYQSPNESIKSLPPQPFASLTKRQDRAAMKTEVSFIIHAQTGMTRKLYNLASRYPLASPLTMRASLEGPYAGHHSLDSYGHVVLVAGSSGITHQLPYISHLLTSAADNLVATRKITLIWVLRDLTHLEWVKPFMDEILRMGNRREMCRMLLFVTRPEKDISHHSPSGSVSCYPGRPNMRMLLKKEVEAQCGAMCVTVCGPGGLADNVREAVREVQEESVVDFIEESFTW